jgi:hypothetical protein
VKSISSGQIPEIKPTIFSKYEFLVESTWIEGEIKDIKGEFILAEFLLKNLCQRQIFTFDEIRHIQSEDVISINLDSENVAYYNLNFFNGFNNKNRKIQNIIKNVKNLVKSVKFMLYSQLSNDIVFLFEANSDKDQFILLDNIMNTTSDFYVILTM